MSEWQQHSTENVQLVSMLKKQYVSGACSVPGCKRSMKNNNETVTFHVLPKSYIIRNEWIRRINVAAKKAGYPIWLPTRHTRICGFHFNATGVKLPVDTYPSFFDEVTFLSANTPSPQSGK